MRTVICISILAIAVALQSEAASAQQAGPSQEPTQAKGKSAPAGATADEQKKQKRATAEAPKKATESPAQAKSSPAEPQGAQAAPSRVDVDDLAAKPAQFVGKNVRVQGEIEELVGPRAFTLDEDSFAATTDVLVVLPRASAVLRDDAEVVVLGAVQLLTRAELERDYGWLDADPEWVVRFSQRPIIVATALQSKKGADLLATAKANPGGETRKNQVASAKPGDIARSPDKFYGSRVAVKGEIEDVFSAHAFTLDEDALFAGPDVLVITKQPAAAAVDGATVRVTGAVRRFTWAEIRSDYDYLGLDNDLIVELENRPVILADSVSRAAND